MPMIEPLAVWTLSPKSWSSWDFTVEDADGTLANIDVSWWREKAAVTIEGQPYRVYREGAMSGDFVLESGGDIIARATKPSAFRRAFELRHDGRTYTLRARGAFRRAFVLEHGSREVGSLVPTSWFGREASVTLPDSLSLPVKIFAIWLAILIWKRDSDGGAVAAT